MPWSVKQSYIHELLTNWCLLGPLLAITAWRIAFQWLTLKHKQYEYAHSLILLPNFLRCAKGLGNSMESDCLRKYRCKTSYSVGKSINKDVKNMTASCVWSNQYDNVIWEKHWTKWVGGFEVVELKINFSWIQQAFYEYYFSCSG